MDSIWRSTFSEFRKYTNGIRDKPTIIQIPLGTFREVKCLSMKYYFVVVVVDVVVVDEGNVIFQEIIYKNRRITELFYCAK
jgi:hypothetical protein